MLDKNKVEIKPGQWVKRGNAVAMVTGVTHKTVFLQTEFARAEDLEVCPDFDPDADEAPKAAAPVTPQADKPPENAA